MKVIENDLKYRLIDLSFEGSIDTWEESKPDYDIDTCAGISVSIEPDDAKTIDEVKSFELSFSVMGEKNITFTRKET
jgi:hypothetical protein